jgi:hypothetical protein
MRRILPLILGVAVVAAACSDTDISEPRLAAGGAQAAHHAGFGPAASATYAVTIHNLTAEGQPFTPPLAVTHRKPISMFTVGEAASFGLKEIAENGNLGPMMERLNGSRHVTDLTVAAGSPPPLLPGTSITFDLSVDRGAKYLSFVSMLICTNDGFTGVDGMRLPDKVGESVHAYADAYDAGTETNTEDFADMVPPCPGLTGVESDDQGTGTSDPALAEGDVVRHHPGIQGIADLMPGLHGWDDPVARIVVERTR